MLRIAICDDDSSQLLKAETLLKDYLRQHPALSGQISLFESGEALLYAAEEHKGFDIYILDILMPDLNGIQTALKLRELDEGGEIIYLTISNDYAADSYNTRAFFYLLKPVDKGKLFSVLDAAVDKLRRRRTESVMVNTHDGTRRILLEQILYVERAERRMCYHCTGETVRSQILRNSFRDAAAELLADPRFFLCGASFVLNLQHIIEVAGQTVLLDTGIQVNLPRKAALPLKSAWGTYWLRGSRRKSGLEETNE